MWKPQSEAADTRNGPLRPTEGEKKKPLLSVYACMARTRKIYLFTFMLILSFSSMLSFDSEILFKQLAPRRRIILEKPPVPQLFKKFF
jgi:hypothetical protein